MKQHRELTGFSREEFASMAELGIKEGQLEESESRILRNLFRFRSSYAEDIMTPNRCVLLGGKSDCRRIFYSAPTKSILTDSDLSEAP